MNKFKVAPCGELGQYNGTEHIKQGGVTPVNQDGCQSALTLWFKRETPKSEQTHLARRHICPRGQNGHVWQRDTPKIFAHGIRTAVTTERDHPQMGSWGNSPLSIGGAKTLVKRPRRVESTPLKA